MKHTIIKCKKCKKVISQCRCMSKDKEVEWSICDGCIAWEAEKAEQVADMQFD